MLTERNVNVEKVKRNLFGSPTKAEKSMFNMQYEKSLEEDRLVSGIISLNRVNQKKLIRQCKRSITSTFDTNSPSYSRSKLMIGKK